MLPCCPREKPCYIHPLELTSVARMLNFGVAGCECFAFENSLDISSIALLEVMHLLLQCLLLLQGAGIYVGRGGEATLTNTDVYENEAGLRYNRVCCCCISNRPSRLLHLPA